MADNSKTFMPANCGECEYVGRCPSVGLGYGKSSCSFRFEIYNMGKRFVAAQQATGGTKAGEENKANSSGTDVVQNPNHYKQGTYEVIDEMIMVFGPLRTYDFCIMNAWKYRARALYKGNTQQDLAKADQYLKMAEQIMLANELGVPQVELIKR